MPAAQRHTTAARTRAAQRHTATTQPPSTQPRNSRHHPVQPAREQPPSARPEWKNSFAGSRGQGRLGLGGLSGQTLTFYLSLTVPHWRTTTDSAICTLQLGVGNLGVNSGMTSWEAILGNKNTAHSRRTKSLVFVTTRPTCHSSVVLCTTHKNEPIPTRFDKMRSVITSTRSPWHVLRTTRRTLGQST
jgi:hypothetical protein